MGSARQGRISQRIGVALIAIVALLAAPMAGLVSPGATLAGPTSAACDGAVTSISEIQGAGDTGLLNGQTVQVRGVVTADFRAGSRLSGFFVQDPAGDGDPQTSDALFVFLPASAPPLPPDFEQDRLVAFSGTVREFNALTELVNPTDLVICGRATVSPTPLG